jgi:hypothetical protein
MFLPITPGTATAANGAATLNQDAGTITTESLSTAGGSTYTLALGCDQVTPNSIVQTSLAYGTATQGDPDISRVTPGNGVVTIIVANRAASTALNGTLKIGFVVFN